MGGRDDGSDGAPGRLDTVVAGIAVASGLTAAWLLFVIATVLPSRDPNGRLGWTVFALVLIGFVTLTAAYLVRRPRTRGLRTSVSAAALIAVMTGGYILVTALSETDHFEGYLVVIGAVVLAHGAAVLLHASTGPLDRETARPS
jgi:hypothetical protein